MSDTVVFKKSIPWLYFWALFAQTIGNALSTMYLIFYITERMLIGVVMMGTIMLLVRIADGIFSVLAGVIVQKTSLKHGQYRSWLLYTPFIVGIGNLLLFVNPAIPQAVKLIQIFVAYMALGAGMSFAQVSQNGLMSRIAGTNIANRLSITAKISQAQQAARIIGAMLAMPMILFFQALGADGYTTTQIVFVIFGVLGQLPLFFKTREYEGYNSNFRQTGASAWNAIQPSNDIVSLLDNYGSKFVFEGGYDTTGRPGWPTATIDEIVAEVERCFREYGGKKGYIFSGLVLASAGNANNAAQTQALLDTATKLRFAGK
jgi:Na+/melibiose symporter-like transporter